MLVWCANRHFQAHTLYIKIYIYVSHESEMMWHFSLFKEMRNKKWKTKQQQEQQEETLVFLFSKCIEFWRWFHFCLPFTFSIIVILFIHLPVNGFYTQQITALLCSNIQRMQKEKFERSFAVFHSIHWRVQFSKTKLYCLYSMAKCLCYPLRAWKTIVCCSHGSVQFSGNWTDGESKRERETEKRLGKSIFAHIRSPSHPLLDLSVGKWFFVVCMKDTYDHTNKGERQVEFNVFPCVQYSDIVWWYYKNSFIVSAPWSQCTYSLTLAIFIFIYIIFIYSKICWTHTALILHTNRFVRNHSYLSSTIIYSSEQFVGCEFSVMIFFIFKTFTLCDETANYLWEF